MKNSFIELKGKYPGTTSLILAGIHGNEKCGLEALNQLLPSLKLERGRLIIGLGNLRAIKNNTRYTEANLNRLFRDKKFLSSAQLASYEYRRAQTIKKYLNRADALLDLHSSRTPDSPAFVICEARGRKIANFLPANLVVSGFDAVEPGGTDSYMNARGKVGLCVECGYVNAASTTATAIKSIIGFLVAQKHIKNKVELYQQTFIDVYLLHRAKSNNFQLQKKFKDFEKVLKNQIIGRDGHELLKAPQDSLIIFARESHKKGDEVFILGKKKA